MIVLIHVGTIAEKQLNGTNMPQFCFVTGHKATLPWSTNMIVLTSVAALLYTIMPGVNIILLLYAPDPDTFLSTTLPADIDFY